MFLSLCGGPLFVGAPVRPNMLNMPKSASVSDSSRVGRDWLGRVGNVAGRGGSRKKRTLREMDCYDNILQKQN